jgi:hypothetical protein
MRLAQRIGHRRFQLGVFGGSGSGKTEYACRFLACAPASCVFIFDPDGEFSDRMNIHPARTTFELDAAIRSGWCAFDPHTMFSGELESGLEYFCKLALAAGARLPGRKLFVVDELQWYVTGHTIPKPLKILVQSGRRVAGLDCVWIGQQPNELHNTIRSQLSEVVAFQITDPTALEWLKKWGFDIEAIRALPSHYFICRNNRGGQVGPAKIGSARNGKLAQLPAPAPALPAETSEASRS